MNGQRAGVFLVAVAGVPQIMSAFLPSPTTAYMGGAHPDRIAWLRRGEVIGSGVSLTLVAGAAMIEQDWRIFAAGVIVLALFLAEYERAIRKGRNKADDNQGAY